MLYLKRSPLKGNSRRNKEDMGQMGAILQEAIKGEPAVKEVQIDIPPVPRDI